MSLPIVLLCLLAFSTHSEPSSMPGWTVASIGTVMISGIKRNIFLTAQKIHCPSDNFSSINNLMGGKKLDFKRTIISLSWWGYICSCQIVTGDIDSSSCQIVTSVIVI